MEKFRGARESGMEKNNQRAKESLTRRARLGY
jgi:hypothetical protein